MERDRKKWKAPARSGRAWDSHLRSTREVSGFHIQANDGKIGHVVDFIIDEEIWAIRYLIIATHGWWQGKRVLVSPQWIGRVGWEGSKIIVDLSREDIRRSPVYTEESFITRDYETGYTAITIAQSTGPMNWLPRRTSDILNRLGLKARWSSTSRGHRRG